MRGAGLLGAALAVAVAVVLPSGALAQVPAPPAAPPPPPAAPPGPAPPPPAPAPPSAAGTLTLAVQGAARVGRSRVVLAGSRWSVRGTLSPYVAGQRVTLRLHRGRKKVAVRSVAVRAAGEKGTFRVRYAAGRAGRFSIRAVHRATAELATLRSAPVRVEVLRARAGAGSRGPVVRLLQQGLDALRYAVPRSGIYDAATGRAVMAYRKVNGMRRIGSADSGVLHGVLARRGAFRPRRPDAGRHLEADLSRQVLALVDAGRVVRTFTTSSGAPATPTILGTFRVYRKDPGTNALGMVHSTYFIRGYAVHGYASVPPYNASHGCLRVPIPDARAIFDWLRMGDRVVVYA